ncbi:MAG: M28 family peptidase [Rhodospirillaceae bacterium]|nr:M28 family peptidase [Rhodospirillaceae bacterium]
MKIKQILCGAILAAFAGGPASAQGTADPSAANIRAHMSFLASDLLQGREAGTPGYDIAAAYVASQMAQLGLMPRGDRQGAAGEASYFQHVPLVAYRATDQGSLALKNAAGMVTPLVFGEDYVVRGEPTAGQTQLNAPLVFVGFGIVAPEHKRDDYKGVDVRGKIAVAFIGAPKSFQTEERAYYTDARGKRAAALAHGAVGILFVNTPTREKLAPFANAARQYASWAMTWRGADGAPFLPSPLPSVGTISLAGAAKLFAGAKIPLATVMAAAESEAGAVPALPLAQSLSVTLHSELKPVESENIVGVIPGSDPVLKDQYVVLSAHLDHIGITPPVNGDSINNGAMDNASGTAITLEVARLFAASGKPPRRSVLFLIDTAEEKGLVGADYFARNPTVPATAIAADVDLDMPVLTYDFTDVVAFGADRSSIGPAVRKVAEGMGVRLSPDPMPDEGIFTRSDHYRFVQQGVPAVFLMTGFANGGEKAFTDFMANNYHKPSDDLSQPIRYDVGAKFARLNYAITRELADATARPAWNKGDFFGDKYAKPR